MIIFLATSIDCIRSFVDDDVGAFVWCMSKFVVVADDVVGALLSSVNGNVVEDVDEEAMF